MTSPAFALIGRSFPSETFETLYQTSLAARADRRDRNRRYDRASQSDRRFRGSGEPVTLPSRLSL